ncbi:MAG: hypothetical protein IPH72_24980 [Sandaracinaceae bacterium]|nr:hypothetical protein [Sandaracinaceae bacterium]
MPLADRFGALPPEVDARIDATESVVLEQCIRRAVTAAQLDDVFAAHWMLARGCRGRNGNRARLSPRLVTHTPPATKQEALVGGFGEATTRRGQKTRAPPSIRSVPMQASMLFNGLAPAGRGAAAGGSPPPAAHTVSGLRAGFTAAVERHAMPRTTLRWRDREHPVAQVHASSRSRGRTSSRRRRWHRSRLPRWSVTARRADLDPVAVTRFTQRAQDGEAPLDLHHAHLDGRSIQRC